jgi:hypothetical protein
MMYPPLLLLLLLALQAVSLRNNNFSGSADQFGSCTLVSLDLAVSCLVQTVIAVAAETTACSCLRLDCGPASQQHYTVMLRLL